ncbi:MAG: hypothetical protein MK236_08690, partial [Pedosphaera sp.]|nr:hypothetical protein [Pedosphaera sp.]
MVITIAGGDVFRIKSNPSQAEKSISKIAEASHDIQRYTKQFQRGEAVEITAETRQGMFEYAFLFVDL